MCAWWWSLNSIGAAEIFHATGHMLIRLVSYPSLQISVLSIPADLYLFKAAKRSTGYTTNMLFACQWACLICLCTAASYAEFERNRVCVLNMPALLHNRSLILFFISSFREIDMYVSYCALMIN